ncbi:hypothetical protein [Gluconacetobacter azotocaptans]|uniref:hypothetical protein n=1 Tax=Gluconacetobacter azotocaptans TaxID=142834 RepID=UPI001FD1A835|nr:hypothetical protein [Gluconacetobacter azotocaptans]
MRRSFLDATGARSDGMATDGPDIVPRFLDFCRTYPAVGFCLIPTAATGALLAATRTRLLIEPPLLRGAGMICILLAVHLVYTAARPPLRLAAIAGWMSSMA